MLSSLRACRRENGALALCSNLFRIPISTSFSSNADPNVSYPRTALQKPKPISKTPTIITQNISFAPPEVPRIKGIACDSNVTSICSIISACSAEKSNLDELLREYKNKLSSELVLQILMNYKQLGTSKTLEFFSWAGMHLSFQFDDSVVEYMADFLGRRKLFDDLKCFLITVSSHNCGVSCRTFSICIRFLGRQGRIEEAISLFEQMESKFKCRPNNLVFNNILYVLCKKESSGHFMSVAIAIFRRIESPDVYSYSNILVGLCKFCQLETALELFCEMSEAGLVPTRSAVNILIGELCMLSSKAGDIQKVRVCHPHRPCTILVPNVSGNKGAIEPATRVFWAVHRLGSLPSAFIIVKLISELCRLGMMGEAVCILKVVEEGRLTCVNESYEIVIKALCERQCVEDVSHLFGRMISQGLKPRLVVYNCIICLLCKMGRLEDAKTVFEIMNNKRCFPNVGTYAALIHAYGEVQNWQAAYNLVMEMLGLGLFPHYQTYNLVDQLLREHSQVDLSLKLERKLEMQLLRQHCKQGQLEVAHEKMRSIFKKGICPPTYIKEAFRRAFQKSGKLRIAQELLDSMDKIIYQPKGIGTKSLNRL